VSGALPNARGPGPPPRVYRDAGTPQGSAAIRFVDYMLGLAAVLILHCRQLLPNPVISCLLVIQLQSTGKVSSRVSAGQKQLVKFRQASSRYGQAENACCGIALVHDLWTPDLFSLIGSYPQE